MAGPVPPLTRHTAIVDVLACMAHLEAGAALATLCTARHRIKVVHDIIMYSDTFSEM